jgi:hypothetical protein
MVLMKTTLEIPNDLFRAAKSKAALDGRKLRDLVTEGLSIVLQTPSPLASRIEFPLIRSKKRTLTTDQVNAALDAEWQEEADNIAHSMRR